MMLCFLYHAAELIFVKQRCDFVAVSFAKDTAQRYKPMQLKRALEYLALADDRLKAYVDEGEVMNILIMQLISL